MLLLGLLWYGLTQPGLPGLCADMPGPLAPAQGAATDAGTPPATEPALLAMLLDLLTPADTGVGGLCSGEPPSCSRANLQVARCGGRARQQ
jgi:hypothetical protein